MARPRTLLIFLFVLLLVPARAARPWHVVPAPDPGSATHYEQVLGVWEFSCDKAGACGTNTLTLDRICPNSPEPYRVQGVDDSGNDLHVVYEDQFFSQYLLFNLDTSESYFFSVSGDTATGNYYLIDEDGELDSFTSFSGRRIEDIALQDPDGDFISDACDNCPNDCNADQDDADGDGQGNACDADIDNDGLKNDSDNCPWSSNAAQDDSDGDSVGDVCDNCPNEYNPGQADADSDGHGDACDETDDSAGAGQGIEDTPRQCLLQRTLQGDDDTLQSCREIRDTTLALSAPGRSLITAYYRVERAGTRLLTAAPGLGRLLRVVARAGVRILPRAAPVPARGVISRPEST